MEPSVAKNVHCEGGHRTYFVDGGSNWGGDTVQHAKKKSICSGGWMGYSFRKYYHFVAPSCKLELARFSALLRIQDGAECGNKETVTSKENM